MNKKRSIRIFSLILIGLFFISFLSFVLAAEGDAEKVGTKIGEDLNSFGRGFVAFINSLFGDTIIGNESLSRLFMAVLIAMFVYTAFGTFFEGQSKYIHWAATIAATALAIYGIPSSFLESIRTGYGAMGAAILSVIPFLIIFWFSIKTKSLLMARITWLFYTFYYFALTLSNWYSKGLWNWPYFIAVVAGFIIFFFILKIRWKFFSEELLSKKEAAEKKVEQVGVAKEISEKMWKTVSGVDTGEGE
jgi:hypothetical protein